MTAGVVAGAAIWVGETADASDAAALAGVATGVALKPCNLMKGLIVKAVAPHVDTEREAYALRGSFVADGNEYTQMNS